MSISPTLRSALNRESADVEIVVLLTISHETLAEPIRVTDSPVQKFDDEIYGLDSRGDRFIYIPFEFTMAGQGEGDNRVQIRIENVDREITVALRNITSPPTAIVELVMAVAPDVVEMSFPDLYMRDVAGDVLSISAELSGNRMEMERYPKDGYSPSLYPGVS